nr:GMC family oxidoreductase [Phytoactinopolyspora mesophila]
MRPESRGRVFLRSADPAVPPVVELGLCSAPEDLDRLAGGVRAAWELLHAPGIGEHIDSVQFWSARTLNDAAVLRSGIRNIANPGWHAVGTARMGPAADPAAVVDQRCRVHGVAGLSVVDASVFPSIPSTPTNLTTMMLAERIAKEMLTS